MPEGESSGEEESDELAASTFTNKLVLYYDASLSAIPANNNISDTIPKQTYNGIDDADNPGGVTNRYKVYLAKWNLNNDNQHGIIAEGELLKPNKNPALDLKSISGRKEADYSKGTLLYRFIVDKSTFIGTDNKPKNYYLDTHEMRSDRPSLTNNLNVISIQRNQRLNKINWKYIFF